MRKKVILMFLMSFIFFIVNSSIANASEVVLTPAPNATVVTNGGALNIAPTTGNKNEDGTLEVAEQNLYSILCGVHANGSGNSVDEMNKYIVLSGRLTQEELDELISKASNSKNTGAQEAYDDLKKMYEDYRYYEATIFVSKEIEGINESESIADGDIYAQDEGETIKARENNKPGILERNLSGLVRSVSDKVIEIMSTCNASLDELIYGRLVRYGTNYYCFELVKGNPYGIIGAYVYGILRSICFAVIAVMGAIMYSKSAMGNGGGESRRKFKEAILNTIIIVLLLGYMPRMIDCVIALKDIILHFFSAMLGEDLLNMFSSPAADGSITGYYKAMAEDSKSLFDALLYLASSWMSLWYAFTYIMTAVSEMVLFIFFPFVIVMSYSDNKLTGQWVKMMVGDIFSPVIDAVLLMVPVLVRTLCDIDDNGNQLKGYLVSLGICYAIIPGRALIKQLMGISGGLKSELMGFGAMMAAGRLMGNLGNRIKNTKDGIAETIRDGKEDREKASLYEELAAASGEGGSGVSLSKMNSVVGGDGEDDNGFNGVSAEDQQTLGALGSVVNADENEDQKNDMDSDDVMEGSNDDSVPELNSTVNGIDDTEGTEEGHNTPDDAANDMVLDSTVESSGEHGAGEEMESMETNGRTAGVGASSEDAPNSDGPDGESVQPNAIDKDAASKALDDEQYGSAVDAIHKNNILKKHANVGNFENPEFQNAFNFTERAQMYRKRANRRLAGGLARNVGGFAGGLAGGAALSTLAGGATMMNGPSSQIMAMTSAGSIGLSVGSAAGTAAVEGARTARAVGSGLNAMYESAGHGATRQILNNGMDAYRQERQRQTHLEFNPSNTTPQPNSLNSYGNVHGIRQSALATQSEMDYNREMQSLEQQQPEAERAGVSEMLQPYDVREQEFSIQDPRYEEPPIDYNGYNGASYDDYSNADYTTMYDSAFSSLGFMDNEVEAYQQTIDAFANMDTGALTEDWQRNLYDTVDAEVNSFMLNEQNAPENWMENPEMLQVAQRQRAVIAGNEMSRVIRQAVTAKRMKNGGKLSSTEEIKEFSNSLKTLENTIKQDLFSRSWKK